MAGVGHKNEKLAMKGRGLGMVAVAVGCCNSALMKSTLPALFPCLFLALQKRVTNFTEKGRKEEKGKGAKCAGLGLCSPVCPLIFFQL